MIQVKRLNNTAKLPNIQRMLVGICTLTMKKIFIHIEFGHRQLIPIGCSFAGSIPSSVFHAILKYWLLQKLPK